MVEALAPDPICRCGERMVWQYCYACPMDRPVGVMHEEGSHCPGPGGYWLCRACNPSLWEPTDGALVWHTRKKKPSSPGPDDSTVILDLSAGVDSAKWDQARRDEEYAELLHGDQPDAVGETVAEYTLEQEG